ncbi:hypothetical protein [Mesorhizobium sp. L-8-3]|uniref:hypothetical protein n=1 Tax=Mesorhizobium sp. L-8-3 TaxID=2744522 RepID=UPI001926CA8A|nr:hypothetical protein [Mesorhizobium sp. L-8-3]BCH26955.1 hypothetical protein MesoLjLb_67400 [Mesorhizobium sp. L-8-3]
MSHLFDASRSLTALEQDNTIVAIIEMSKAKWLIAALVPGCKRQPRKKVYADTPSLLKLLQRWGDQAGQAGQTIKRIAVAYGAAARLLAGALAAGARHRGPCHPPCQRCGDA